MINTVACRLLTLFSLVAIILATTFLFLDQPAQAAPHPPLEPTSSTNLLITGTKYATPAAAISPGGTLTYTIIFTVDRLGLFVVTDTLPANTALTGVPTGSPISYIITNTLTNTLVWTITNAPTDTQVTLTATVQVADTTPNGTLITNTAFLSDATGIIPTNVTANMVVVPPTTAYLPLVIKSEEVQEEEKTLLTVTSSNTGDFTLEIRQISDNALVISCTVANNSSTFCGEFPPGTYKVVVLHTVCGSAEVERTFSAGPANLPISC